MQANDVITWFEIPVKDLARATRFYELVLDTKLKAEAMEGASMSMFAHSPGGVGGCLVQHAAYEPSRQGTVPYLNANPSIDAALARVNGAGGQISLGKTALPDGLGFYAHVLDCEGNRVGLHALS